MNWFSFRRFLYICIVALVLGQGTAIPSAEPLKKNGYLLGDAVCGEGKNAFPRLPIGMQAGYCAGLVAGKDDGLTFPRNIVQVPGSSLFVVVDMGSWSPGRGRLLLLDPAAPAGKRIKVLIPHLALPHGLAIGIDQRVYASEADKIFRFDPLAANPEDTVEVIVRGLPGINPKLADGTVLPRNFHPLKHFIFDRTGRIFVNVGAPTDACATSKVETKPCVPGEGPTPMASVWMFTPPQGGLFPALKPGDANPPFEIYARGLRNSMALAAHPRFPDEGFALLQAENGRDLPDPFKPNEELNHLLPGKHYGWPYCYDLSTESPEYKSFLQTSTAYKRLCDNKATYRQPLSLLPPHSAPLGMMYYNGSRLAGLHGKLLVGLHGYRPTGSRLIYYDVNDKGFPAISPPPMRYNVSCGKPSTEVFRTETMRQVPAARYRELISQWYEVDGLRPRGAPVGMTIADDGAIWLVEDKNQTIIRIDNDPASATVEAGQCGGRSEAEIKQIVNRVLAQKDQAAILSHIRANLIEKHCVGCHSGFGIEPGQSGRQKDEASLRFMLGQEGWILPQSPATGQLHVRLWGNGSEKIMPDNGRELLASDPAYRALLEEVDRFVQGLASANKPSAAP